MNDKEYDKKLKVLKKRRKELLENAKLLENVKNTNINGEKDKYRKIKEELKQLKIEITLLTEAQEKQQKDQETRDKEAQEQQEKEAREKQDKVAQEAQ